VPIVEKLHDEYKDKAVFAFVYITEAHAANEWPFGPTLSFCDQPTSLGERCGLARSFVNKFDCKVPMLVDGMDNSFEQHYAAWPVRFYVIKDDKLALKAQPNVEKYGYEIGQLRDWLASNTAGSN